MFFDMILIFHKKSIENTFWIGIVCWVTFLVFFTVCKKCMPRITDVIKELWIDKEQFAGLYQQVMGDSLKPKTSVVSEKNYAQIKVLAKKSSSKKKKSVPVAKKEIVKVIKKDQFQDKTWFLSWLGFETKKESEIDEEEVKEETMSVATKSDFDLIKEQAVAKKEKSRKAPFNFSKPAKPSFTKGTYAHRSSYSRPSKPYGKKKWTFSVKKPEQKPIVKKQPKISTTSKNLIRKEEIILDDRITVKEFTEKVWVELPEVMKVLLRNQIMVGINSSLDFDTACLIWEELGVKVKKQDAKLNVESFLSGDLQAILNLDKEAENLQDRPPIITVMGHVDHGKTTLLDYLRKTSVAEWEAWGITQSIGASVVDYDGKKITFIDTPGHELFTSLRARGAKLTNIAVIVVAADDGLMPQTIESINHAKAASVPIVIAVTKIDKPGVKIDQIKTDIARYGLTSEDWWWDTPVIGVSGKTGKGVSDLLEAILLQAEMLELKFNPNRSAVGVVLDAYKDPKQGIVASVIVMTGTLKIRDITVAYNTYGKIKRMRDRKGKDILEAVGGEPIQVLWFTEIPEPGRIVEIVSSEKEAMNKVNLIQAQHEKENQWSVVQEFVSQLQSGGEDVAVLKLVLKADGSSSLEALIQAVAGIEMPHKVEIKVIHANVGPFSDSDLALAQASKTLMCWFNLPITTNLKKKSQANGVEVKCFDVIYELTEYIEQIVLWMVVVEQEEVVLGKLEILGVFFRKGKEMVIWGKVIEGKVKNNLKFRVIRKDEDKKDEDAKDDNGEANNGEDEFFTKGMVTSLQKDKNSAKEVTEGHECGMKVKVPKKIIEWDVLEFLIMQDVVS